MLYCTVVDLVGMLVCERMLGTISVPAADCGWVCVGVGRAGGRGGTGEYVKEMRDGGR